MDPRTDDELLCTPSCLGAGSLAKSGVVLQCASEENVEPAAQVIDRGFDLVVVAVDGQLPPIRPVLWVREEVVVPVSETFQEGTGGKGQSFIPVIDIVTDRFEH